METPCLLGAVCSVWCSRTYLMTNIASPPICFWAWVAASCLIRRCTSSALQRRFLLWECYCLSVQLRYLAEFYPHFAEACFTTPFRVPPCLVDPVCLINRCARSHRVPQRDGDEMGIVTRTTSTTEATAYVPKSLNNSSSTPRHR